MPSRCRFCCTGRCDDLAVGAAGDDDADLGGERQPLLEHAGHAAERGAGRGELGPVGDPALALAVVAEARRLQDAGQQRVGDARRGRARVVDHRVRRAGDAAARERRLLGRAVLADRDRRRRPARPAGARASVASAAAGTFSNSVVMRGAALGQAREAGGVEVVGADVLVRDQCRPGWPRRGRAPRCGSPSLRGVHEHAAELAAADDAERRARAR